MVAPTVPEHVVDRDPPLERDAALQALARAHASACAGRGGAVVVTGPAGTGLTTLLDAFAAHVQGRALVARWHAAEAERGIAWGVLRELVTRVQGDGPVPAALLEPGAGTPAAWFDLLARHARERPVHIVVDDLQWADEPSAHALVYAARRAADHSLLVVAGVRDDAAGRGRRGPLEAAGARVVRAAALGEDACAALVARRLGAPADPAFVRACRTATGGVPWLLDALLAACAERGIASDRGGAERIAGLAPAPERGIAPDAGGAEQRGLVPASVRRRAAARIAPLGADAARLAWAVAVLGSAWLSDAAAVAGLGEPEAAAALERLVGARILTDALPVAFELPLLGAAVAAELGAADRDALHRAAARVLADADPARAAAHLLHCEPRGETWAVVALCAAARSAAGDVTARRPAGTAAEGGETAVRSRDGVPEGGETAVRRLEGVAAGGGDVAERWLDRAEAEGGDVEARVVVAAALADAADPRALVVLQAARGRSADPALRARLAVMAAELRFADDGPAAIELLVDALGEADRAGIDADDLAFAIAILGRDQLELPAHVARRAAAVADRPRRGALAAVEAYCAGGPAAAVVDAARTAVTRPAALSGAGLAPAFYLSTWMLAACDAVDDAETAIVRAEAMARERGSALTVGTAHLLRALLSFYRGDVAATAGHAEHSLRLASGGSGFAEPTAYWVLLEAAVLRGDAAAAESALAAGLRAADRWGVALGRAFLLHGRAALRLRGGDAAGALEDAQAAGAVMRERGVVGPAVLDWRLRAARAAAALGDVEHVRALADEGLRGARAVGSARVLTVALQASALACSGPSRIVALQAAAEAAERCPSRVVHAEALLELGAAMRRARMRRAAREPLRRALHLATEAGAAAIAEDARRELDASGARLQPGRVWGAESLTPRERELAALAADGLANAEIAARLVISRKTVETHLSAVYRKLDIASRAELAGVLGDASAGASADRHERHAEDG